MDIKAEREARNMTPKEFADALGVNLATVYRWEGGDNVRPISLRTIIAIGALKKKRK